MGGMPIPPARRERLKGEVIQLRSQGLSYRKCAMRLGISYVECFILEKEALKEIRATNAGMTEEYRELEISRCEEHLDILADRLEVALKNGDDEKINKNIEVTAKVRGNIIKLRQLDGHDINLRGTLDGTVTVKRDQRAARLAELMKKAQERKEAKEKPIAALPANSDNQSQPEVTQQ